LLATTIDDGAVSSGALLSCHRARHYLVLHSPSLACPLASTLPYLSLGPLSTTTIACTPCSVCIFLPSELSTTWSLRIVQPERPHSCGLKRLSAHFLALGVRTTSWFRGDGRGDVGLNSFPYSTSAKHSRAVTFVLGAPFVSASHRTRCRRGRRPPPSSPSSSSSSSASPTSRSPARADRP
ncbi:hypothetical protein B0H19DRAFT_1386492, partial [Mycena capillaripes]